MVYTYSQAEYVARKELELHQLQRKRVKFEKITHLQDEEGDTIQIVHPYTGADVKVFVTNIKRRFPVVDAKGSEEGFIDEIEGWVLS